VIPLVHYITLYEKYHFFGPPCRPSVGCREKKDENNVKTELLPINVK